MTLSLPVIGRFLIGNASAIREVAGNRAALWTGIGLVLLTGIARNYDQNYFLETPMWLIGPLIFSLFSGSFLYGILIRMIARRHFPLGQEKAVQWPTFMALFWMTAPIAWLYAIPVERFVDSYHAAQANLALLGIVSLWRVLLMSRILAVLFEIHYLRALLWVMIGASLEVIVVVFFAGFFDGSFGRRILAGMAGMRNAPEEALLSSVLGSVWGWSWAVLVLCLLLLTVRRLEGDLEPLPAQAAGKVPWTLLVCLAVIWSLISIAPQREQRHFVAHATLVARAEYKSALTYLGQHQRSDFPPGRRLEPNPYEYRVWQNLPPTIALLTSQTAPWIRELYLNHLTATLSHFYPRYDSLTNVADMLLAIEQLPEGRAWMLTNEAGLGKQGLGLRYRNITDVDTSEFMARSNILNVLDRMGMAETNLAKLRE